MRMLRVLLGVLVFAAAGLVPTGAAQATPVPTVTATPTTNLVDRQVITLTGSGLPALVSVGLSVCGTQTSACYPIVYRPVTTASGTLSAPVAVPRRVFDGGAVLDCAQIGCQLVVRVTGGPTNTIPLTFDPTKPFTPQTIDLAPEDHLPYLASVRLRASGYDQDARVHAVQCFSKAIPGGGGTYCRRILDSRYDLSGNLSADVTVVRRVFNHWQNLTYDCTDAGTTCNVQVDTPPRESILPLTFDPNASIPPITVSLADDSVTEGTPETHTIASMSEAADHPITIQYTVRHDTARPGVDYVKKVRHMTFLPGETRHVIRVAIVDDIVREPTERFRIDIDSITGAGAAIGRGRQYTTITDND